MPFLILVLLLSLISSVLFAQSTASQNSTSPFSLSASASSSLGSCSPVKSGDPFGITPSSSTHQCGSADPAVLNDTSVPAGVGNPINVMTGNKYQREVDLPALPGVLGLELVRHYNSQEAKPGQKAGILGRGWRLSYDTRLTVNDNNTLFILQADGSRLIFNCPTITTATVCTHTNPLKGTVTLVPTSTGMTYHWRWANGRVLRFGSAGTLELIVAPTGEFISLTYDNQHYLSTIKDPQGRTLRFIYPDKKDPAFKQNFRGVQRIETPIGTFHYTYGTRLLSGSTANPLELKANLLSIQRPIGSLAATLVVKGFNTRTYHYEDPRYPSFLTGITLAEDGIAPQRLNTWAYDDHQRAILSVKGKADSRLERVSLNFSQPDTTILFNSLGQKTVYRYTVLANEYRLLEVVGAGCVSCGEVNRRYQYDTAGLLTNILFLSSKGKILSGLQAVRDTWGRVIQLNQQQYVENKIVATHWLKSFEYEALSDQPIQIKTPSRTPGKEHILHYRYNPQGQVLEETETGWSQQQSLSRTTVYRYTLINGRSLLTTIDGPLKNGPQQNPTDSDITEIHWDQSTWGGGNTIESITEPGARTTKFEHHVTGWLSRIAVEEAGRKQQIEITYTLQGQYLSQHTIAWLTDHSGHIQEESLLKDQKSFVYNALEKLIQITNNAGHQMTLAYDNASHLITMSDSQGYRSQLTLDGEGHPLVAGLYEPQQKQPLRAWYHWFDEAGRPSRTLYPDGRLFTTGYSEEGLLAQHNDGDRVQHTFLRPSSGAALTIAQATDGDIRVQSTEPDNTIFDDFGRPIESYALGRAFHAGQYDEADRCIARTEANGTKNIFQYNARGQLIHKQQNSETTKFEYQGSLLKAVIDPIQTQRYKHDALGRVTHTTTTIQQHTFTTGQSFAQNGLSERFELADGRSLLIQRDQLTQKATDLKLINHFWSNLYQHAPTFLRPYLSWLPNHTLLEKIIIHPFNGWVSFTQGNGIRTHKQFDLAGRLTQLSVQGTSINEQHNYQYDIGPRIQSDNKNNYHYTGFGKLTSTAKIATQQKIERDTSGRTLSDGTFRYTYTSNNQIETVTALATKKLIAHYAYNAFHQRVMKTVYIGKQPITTYFLWHANHLVAESDSTGHITDQYIYLTDEHQPAMPIAKLESHINEPERLLFIHTDHRGAPVMMTDTDQNIIWQATLNPWGTAKHSRGSAILNLRLPGQYFDAETGLHDNLNRTYDPRPTSPNFGHYLTPDPLPSIEPYLYAEGDPINGSDPLGLYQIDVHYYMTYFLAEMAGMNPYDAQTVALAAQYVDDNPYTWPLDPDHIAKSYVDDIDGAKDRLANYHFTQAGYDRARKYNESDEKYLKERIKNPSNPQLTNLLAVSNKPKCSIQQLQLFGEYLHAFEDSFGHRDKKNNTIKVNEGFGHAIYDTHPDMTYNHFSFTTFSWSNNEDRTLEMEKEVYEQIKKHFNLKNAPDFSTFEKDLKNFNSLQEDEENSGSLFLLNDYGKKLNTLNIILLKNKLPTLPTYNIHTACQNKKIALQDLNSKDYPGVILNFPKTCPKQRAG